MDFSFTPTKQSSPISRRKIMDEGSEYHAKVSERAYLIWVAKGKNPHDDPAKNWYEAEQQLWEESSNLENANWVSPD